MKIVRVRIHGDEIAYGVAEPEGIRVHRGTPFVAWEPTEVVIPFDEARLLAPVFPTKVVGVGTTSSTRPNAATRFPMSR